MTAPKANDTYWRRDRGEAWLYLHPGGAFTAGQAFLPEEMKKGGRRGVYRLGSRGGLVARSWKQAIKKMEADGWHRVRPGP